MDPTEKIILWLIANSLGGVNRGRIITEIFKRPQNAHELSKSLNLEYKTVRHHLKVLEENNLLTHVGKKYGCVYFPSLDLERKKDFFLEIWNRFGKNQIKGEAEE